MKDMNEATDAQKDNKVKNNQYKLDVREKEVLNTIQEKAKGEFHDQKDIVKE
jgi:hypothetical protein